MKKIIAILTLALAISCNTMAQSVSSQEIEKLTEVLNSILGQYVDTINQTRLINGAIRVALEQLDPHSNYKTLSEVEEENRKINPLTRGIGATFRLFDDTLTAVKVEPNGPAYKAGIRPGTQIESINSQTVTNRLMSVSKVQKIIRNCCDDSISICIFKKNSIRKLTLPMAITRASSIESHFAPSDTCIYVRISHFNKSTGADFERVISKYGNKHRRNIILDLRDNPGGTLMSSLDICEHFLSENMLMLSSRGHHQKDTNYFATDKGLLIKSRVCVLMNENSASASEVIAGCIQDWDRGLIVGRRSYGKGITQQKITLNDGSQLRLTNSRLYAPSGRCVQKGYQKGQFDKYFNETAARKENGENETTIRLIAAKAPKFETILRHRTVHGSIGIVPDVYVSEDTVKTPRFWDSWMENKVIENFVYDKINSSRDLMSSSYGTFKIFLETFAVTDTLMRELHAYASADTSHNEKIPVSMFSEYLKMPAASYMRNQLKAQYAYAMFGANEHRQTLSQCDKDYNAALMLINNPAQYNDAF